VIKDVTLSSTNSLFMSLCFLQIIGNFRENRIDWSILFQCYRSSNLIHTNNYQILSGVLQDKLQTLPSLFYTKSLLHVILFLHDSQTLNMFCTFRHLNGLKKIFWIYPVLCLVSFSFKSKSPLLCIALYGL
jgi:hypothetical protein